MGILVYVCDACFHDHRCSVNRNIRNREMAATAQNMYTRTDMFVDSRKEKGKKEYRKKEGKEERKEREGEKSKWL